jgi:hypothetical protein
MITMARKILSAGGWALRRLVSLRLVGPLVLLFLLSATVFASGTNKKINDKSGIANLQPYLDPSGFIST